jgi:hypothetical protein
VERVCTKQGRESGTVFPTISCGILAQLDIEAADRTDFNPRRNGHLQARQPHRRFQNSMTPLGKLDLAIGLPCGWVTRVAMAGCGRGDGGGKEGEGRIGAKEWSWRVT